jgi:phosphotransferase system enzyme I (PtsI)/phosphotransferase system enzyme I (PtsP)
VLLEIHRILQTAVESRIAVSICGEMASDPVAVVLLIGLGLRTLSMSATKIPRIKWLVRNLQLSVAQQLSRDALECKYPGEIRSRVEAVLQAAGLQELFSRTAASGPA